MSFLSDAALERLQTFDESAMPDSCRVLRREITVVGGRTTYGPETVAAGPLDCRLERSGLQPHELEGVGRIAEESYGRVALPLGTDVQGKDRVEVTTAWGVTTFEVIADPWAPSYATSLTVTVQREE